MDAGDPQVSYSVKDLLADIKTSVTAGFARLEAQMAGKADKADLVVIHARLDDHEKKLSTLELDRSRVQAVTDSRVRRWSARQTVMATAAGVVAAIATAAAVVYTLVR